MEKIKTYWGRGNYRLKEKGMENRHTLTSLFFQKSNQPFSTVAFNLYPEKKLKKAVSVKEGGLEEFDCGLRKESEELEKNGRNLQKREREGRKICIK